MANRSVGLVLCLLFGILVSNVSAQRSLVDNGTNTVLGSFSFQSYSTGGSFLSLDAGMGHNIQDNLAIAGRLNVSSGGGTTFGLSAGPEYYFGDRRNTSFPSIGASLGILSAPGYTDGVLQFGGGYDFIVNRSTIVGLGAAFQLYFGGFSYNIFRISSRIGFILP